MSADATSTLKPQAVVYLIIRQRDNACLLACGVLYCIWRRAVLCC